MLEHRGFSLSNMDTVIILPTVSIAPMTGLGYTLLVHCDIILSFLVSVMAGIVSYYVCKWLDGNDSTQPESSIA